MAPSRDIRVVTIGHRNTSVRLSTDRRCTPHWRPPVLDDRLDGMRNLFITGGSRGIGAATARMAAADGWNIFLTYANRRDDAEAVAADCRLEGVDAECFQLDVSSEQSVTATFRRFDERAGALHCLVNNAGMLEQQSRLDAFTAERLERVFATNVIGAFLCAREAVRRMSTRHGGSGGSIVNVSSAASRLGSPNEYIDYAASKGAIDTMTIGLAREVATEGIRVNAVRPGLIETEIHASGGDPGRVARLAPGTPMGRGGTADEVAGAILYLASEAASYVTGSFIEVSGGR
jgi:NAD(P)-dependent dehydrogenase (short-subunit alcohol dehydrogenase family)